MSTTKERTPPLLSILVPSLPERITRFLLPLWAKLEAQIAANSQPGEVEIVCHIDNRQRTVGEKRDNLMQVSQGEYVAYADDDDDVSDDYVARLIAAIKGNRCVDVITFQQRAIINGTEGICTFGLGNPNEQFTPAGFLRAPWHVCAWRGTLARRFRFPASNQHEDWGWAQHLNLVAKTSHHIPAVLHIYNWHPAITAANPAPGTPPAQKPTTGFRCTQCRDTGWTNDDADTVVGYRECECGQAHKGQIRSWQDIPGWFDFPNVYAVAVQNAPKEATFVEIGAWLGKSTAFMLFAIRESGKQIEFNSFDTFKGSVTEPEHLRVVESHGGSILEAARANLRAACWAGAEDALVESDSVAAAANYQDGEVDFCFIDGDHTEAGARRDIEAWLPKIRPGGILAGHDIDAPTVRAAVVSVLGETSIGVSGRCWIYFRPAPVDTPASVQS